MPEKVTLVTVEMKIELPLHQDLSEVEEAVKKIAADNNAKLLDWWNVKIVEK